MTSFATWSTYANVMLDTCMLSVRINALDMNETCAGHRLFNCVPHVSQEGKILVHSMYAVPITALPQKVLNSRCCSAIEQFQAHLLTGPSAGTPQTESSKRGHTKIITKSSTYRSLWWQQLRHKQTLCTSTQATPEGSPATKRQCLTEARRVAAGISGKNLETLLGKCQKYHSDSLESLSDKQNTQ